MSSAGKGHERQPNEPDPLRGAVELTIPSTFGFLSRIRDVVMPECLEEPGPTPPVLRQLFEPVTSAEEAALNRKAKAEAFQASGSVEASRVQILYLLCPASRKL